MDPVAFEIFGMSIRWYGILISLGVLLGTIIAMKEAKRIGYSEDTIIDLLLFAIPISIIGARLYYVAFSWDQYSGDILSIINTREGGMAIHGALISAILVAIIFCKVKKINFWTLADILAPSIILGQGIGRWGNFINQEAHGGPTNLPWGIIVDGQKVHPTFLYESLWNIAVFLFLIWFRKNKSKVEGETFLLYLILYSLGRFFIEGLRTDSLMFGILRIAQVISLIAIIIASIIFVLRRRKNENKI
ncbi:prolipoprotein diacylglyceryl transferase Lgt [Gottschalkia acidurici 9a]|uniref:Phosphatidylglycerol--prolipoprotein diacylglyceryl transferase n=1 Tax=Gottschalkia acidurici (strain ATCC 7906 / DSM 604 / BCRC 14475 / CIP 104303 / KCTC 5404 / NCIMB 10678 / 9a) TaxID=1128398 RepID=K0AWW0_GOTA9|nr:prolipoprotein diacylglyceryl transferase [Gottschalkia acidurici]AFS78303.1 prolipoprotein diacylglyceryl transferase Lgt [Gottschalkia acidurici 9a]